MKIRGDKDTVEFTWALDAPDLNATAGQTQRVPRDRAERWESHEA